MYDEVFSPSFGNRPSFLVGRSQLLSQLEQGLQSRGQPREDRRVAGPAGQREDGASMGARRPHAKAGLRRGLPDHCRRRYAGAHSREARGRLPAVRGAGNCTSQAAAWARSASRRASN